ncbi:hypothetical protein [Aneurinibacillus soli]|uniref:hypothetical protein n=1 Tax=Aneurinibacillus soli TaxID=1500254 RepID=UPI001E493FD5|nr:hypothetical protein [Aneurinibacillus soli]
MLESFHQIVLGAGSGGATERLYATPQQKGLDERAFVHNASSEVHRGLSFVGEFVGHLERTVLTSS